jgi:predicted phage tail protein
MIKTIFRQIQKVLKGKLNKFGLEQKLAKYPDYIVKAKEIWEMINKDLGISDTIENKLISKVDKFEKALLDKFPELTNDDVTEIRQSIVRDINESKVDDLKQLQDSNTKLQEENAELKNQLSKFQSLDSENTVTVANETTIDTKQ